MMSQARDWDAVAERVHGEKMMPVSRAAKLVPTNRGRRGHASAEALVRWIINGKSGIYLDGVRCNGKTWWTSAEAIRRFMADLSRAGTGKPETARVDSPAQLRRRADAAMREMGML